MLVRVVTEPSTGGVRIKDEELEQLGLLLQAHIWKLGSVTSLLHIVYLVQEDVELLVQHDPLY